ncbi:MAG: ABC transporter ATP-binding protein [Thermoplasmata archaeon]
MSGQLGTERTQNPTSLNGWRVGLRAVSELSDLSREFRGLQGTFLGLTVVQLLLSAAVPLLIGAIIDDISVHDFDVSADVVTIFIILVIYRLVGLATQYVLALTQIRLGISTQTGMVSSVNYTSIGALSQFTKGDLLSRIMSDALTVASSAVTFTLSLYGLIASTAISLVVLLYLSPPMTAIAVLSLPVFYLVVLATGNKITRETLQERRIYSASTEELRVILDSQLTLRALSSQDYSVKRFQGAMASWSTRARRLAWLGSITGNSSGFLLGVVPLGIFVLGLYLVSRGETSLGSSIAFFVYVPTLFASVMGITALYTSIASVTPRLERVREVSALRTEHSRGMSPNKLVPVEVRNLTVTAPGVVILSGVTLTINPGVTVVSGPNGSGKSTLLKVIAGIEHVYQGSVRLGGYDLRQISLDTVRKSIVLVGDHDAYFAGTLRDCISLGTTVPDVQIEEALRVVGLNHLSTQIGEAVHPLIDRLSTGERQRFAVARAILKQPELIILDESLSAVDGTQEAIIIQSIIDFGIPGIVVVSHREPVLRAASARFRLLRGCLVDPPHAEPSDLDGQ